MKSYTKYYRKLYNLEIMSVQINMFIPVIESKTRSPIRRAKNCLNGTGQVCETVAHQKEPANTTKSFQHIK